ncbi:hypothetical protein [Stenotrophomonas sp. NPDC078853]|uniref:hypothetical protein n=1 Tax=Stenotrophomonas sp. NPDC078853 TaxID=3364534 RepID=UPI00384D66DE
MDKLSGINSVIPDDMLTALRVQPQLHGIVAQNSSSLGDIGKAPQVWAALKLAPLQAHMTAINEWRDMDVICFNPFTAATTGT